METINFEEFYKYFSKVIKDTNDYLYEEDKIENKLEFVIYGNTGDYLDTVMNTYNDNDENSKPIIVNIANDGGVQDASISINTYLQSITLEMLAYEEQRPDVEVLMTEIVTNYKTKLETIHGATCNIQMSDLPEYSGKFDAQGEEKFTSVVGINIIVFPDAFLSNEYVLNINGFEVKYNSCVINRDVELTADLQKRNTTKYYPNTTGLSLAFNGLYVDNQVLNDMLMDCARNSKFNQYYNIKLSRNGKDIISDSFYARNLKFTLAYGSIVQWEATFCLGINI